MKIYLANGATTAVKVDTSNPSQRTDAVQRLIAREMRASGADYKTAWERVASDPENSALFSAMSQSDANLARNEEMIQATEAEQASMKRLRSQAPARAPGSAKFPPNSQSPPQIKTLRAHGSPGI